MAGIAAARSVFALPATTGPWPVGTTTFTLHAATGEQGPAQATYAVQVWYPGERTADRAPYGAGGPGVRRWLYRRIVTTQASRDVAMAALPRRAPVLIYVASWGGERSDNTALIEELASHGFVVAAVGDVMFDDPPDSRLARPLDFSSKAAYDATVRLGNERLPVYVRRVSSVLDFMTSLDAGDTAGRFTHRLDLGRAGILGYSFGGAVALAACRHDSRLHSAMNMDGWIFGAGNAYRGGVRYFLMSDDDPLPDTADVTSSDPVRRYTSLLTLADDGRQRAVLQFGGYELRLHGADHLSFSDVPLYALLHHFGRRGADARRRAETIRRHATAFFDLALNGAASPLFASRTAQSPGTTLAVWPVRTHPENPSEQ